jgi:heat shock protein HslJ
MPAGNATFPLEFSRGMMPLRGPRVDLKLRYDAIEPCLTNRRSSLVHRWNVGRLARLGSAIVLVTAAAQPAIAQAGFPYERDLVFDARPMRGGKRVPILSIDQTGRAQIDLWCKRGQGEALVAGDGITILIGAMREESCTPERAQADEELIAALGQVTSWSARGDVVTLSGGPTTLRFRAATN